MKTMRILKPLCAVLLSVMVAISAAACAGGDNAEAGSTGTGLAETGGTDTGKEGAAPAVTDNAADDARNADDAVGDSAIGNVDDAVIDNATGEKAAKNSYTSDNGSEHALTADGEKVSYENIAVTKTGDGEGEDADFYGENAAVFAANGAELTLSGADITTDGKYANAVFSYGEGTVINISGSTINTSQRNSGGIMVTGGGTLNAEDLTIETQGGSSAAIRSDRGGGTINVNGGSYTANGSGSPAIYSTADITVSNASLRSGSAQAVVVEGGNNVTLKDCDVVGNNTAKNSDKSDYYQAVMLYQSMSGDASGGEGFFTMAGGSLTSANKGMFFVTNATYTINLSNVEMTYADDELLRICRAGWGNEGSNGGQVKLNADGQKLEGNIIVDEISKLNMYLTDGSDFTGTFENIGEVYVELDENSTWTLTGDCSITSLTCDGDAVRLNGHKLTVGGKEYTEGSKSSGEAVVFTVREDSGMKHDGKPGDKGHDPERPDDDGRKDMTPPDGGTPPEKPDGDGSEPPRKPDGDGSEPPEKPD